MPPKVLRRCSLCNNFHAAYLVEDKRLGKLYLCYACWKARQAAKAPPQSPGGPEKGEKPAGQGSKAAGDRGEDRAER